ncbi:MAG: hypothetical protein QOH72_5415 [Solirubrobacteraceae bacterium]|nr:hypothetical protein [Solirubrobacteraceae bacterium]
MTAARIRASMAPPSASPDPLPPMSDRGSVPA